MAALPGPVGLIGRFFGNTVSAAAGFAAGVAVGPVLAPPVEQLRQTMWAAYPTRIPEVVTLAEGVAAGHVDPTQAAGWATAQGYAAGPWNALVAIAASGPGVGQAFELWRRGAIDDAGFARACKRAALEDEWITALTQIKRRLLSPAELSNAVVQGFLTIPQAAPDAALQGYSAADFQTMVNVTGLPPGPETLQDWRRRGIIDDAQLDQGIREGHTKTKYLPEFHASLPRVLSAAEYAGLRLRGWITAAESYIGGALTGYDQAAMDYLFLNRGRPATTHQVHIGYARGGRLATAGNNERATFARAIEESDIRPEWEPILWAQRYSYPSAFVLRALTQAGDLTALETETILLYEGWEPTLAAQVAGKWATATAAAGKAETKAELLDEYEGGYLTAAQLTTQLTALGYSGANLNLEMHLADARRVKKWREKAVDAIGKAYISHAIDAPTATADLAAVNVTGQAAASLLPIWDLERRVGIKQLTAAQVVRAYKKNLMTVAAATLALEDLGYSPSDAATMLAF